MMYKGKPSVVFIFNLLQDVGIFWPLVNLVARETSYTINFILTDNFIKKDINEIWRTELAELELLVSAVAHYCETPIDIRRILVGKSGVMFSASESSLNPHRFVHEIFKCTPATFVRVTLQHGYECSGFRQNREQSIAFSSHVEFAADIVCSWTEPSKLTHTHLSDLSKVVVTGPTSRIKCRGFDGVYDAASVHVGLVCENLHSTRMNTTGDFKNAYMDTFLAFGKFMSKRGDGLALRPHPGGQFVVKNGVALPEGMTLKNGPMYRLDLSQFAFGISAPSSVLIDMVFAGIPTAVWHDGGGLIDASAYEGLTRISTLGEWIAFADAAITNPAPFLAQQQRFLENSGMVTDPEVVEANYLELIRALCGHGPGGRARVQAKRILFVANGDIPTLQICFMKPLQGLFDAGAIDPLLITEAQVRKAMGPMDSMDAGAGWFESVVGDHRPDVVVFCRYSGPLSEKMISILHGRDVPVIYHIDDDLLNVPKELGAIKHAEHNSPSRILSVACGIMDADIVYCSTKTLEDRIKSLGFKREFRTGPGHCAGDILVYPVDEPVRTIGYMGFDHVHDLAMITPSIVKILQKYQHLRFELFGTIPMPDEILIFGDRVSSHLPVRPYDAFLTYLATLRWDIGLCPLANTHFNRYKANNKWVEYTSVGAAVVATSDMVYDECCADDCGILVPDESGWFDALDALCAVSSKRFALVKNAQQRLLTDYSVKNLQLQVLQIFDEAQLIRKSP